MVIVNEDKNLIIAHRGDTIILDIDIVDDQGNPYVPDPTDQLRFAIKRSYEDEEPLFIKDIPIDTCQLVIEAEDTEPLEQPASYVYDIQLTYGNGEIISTIIPNKDARKAVLKLVEEVE